MLEIAETLARNPLKLSLQKSYSACMILKIEKSTIPARK
jgi:hypothetical protein